MVTIRGCGFSFDKPSAPELVAARAAFALRYVGGDPAKTLNAAEFTALSAAHIPLVLVHETTAEWMLGGFDAGVNGAHLARADMAMAGVPLTVPIFAAADFDVQPAQVDDVMAAASGFDSVLGHTRTGVYGGLRIAQAAADAGYRVYQANAWSGPEGSFAWDPRAVLRQTGKREIGGLTVDAIEAVSFDFAQYTPPPPPWPGRLFSYAPGAPEVHGEDVRAWQQRMGERGWTLLADGWYGPKTAAVCLEFQEEFNQEPQPGLLDDAIVGPATWAAAFTVPITG